MKKLRHSKISSIQTNGQDSQVPTLPSAKENYAVGPGELGKAALKGQFWNRFGLSRQSENGQGGASKLKGLGKCKGPEAGGSRNIRGTTRQPVRLKSEIQERRARTGLEDWAGPGQPCCVWAWKNILYKWGHCYTYTGAMAKTGTVPDKFRHLIT